MRFSTEDYYPLGGRARPQTAVAAPRSRLLRSQLACSSAIYLMLVALWVMLRQRWSSFWRYGWAAAAVGGTVAAILALNLLADRLGE